MGGPTLIESDYTKSAFFNNGPRLVFNLDNVSSGRSNEVKSVDYDTLLCSIENGIEAFEFNLSNNESLGNLKKAHSIWKGHTPNISIRLNLSYITGSTANLQTINKEEIYRIINTGLELSGADQFDHFTLHIPEESNSERISSVLDIIKTLADKKLLNLIGVSGLDYNSYKDLIKKGYINTLTGYNNLNACNLDALINEIPHLKKEGLGFVNFSADHMSLLGSRLEQYSRERAIDSYVSGRDIDIAVMASRIARKNNMSLSEMAFRYAFSMEESDRIVARPDSIIKARTLIDSWSKGPLSKELFNTVTSNIVKYYS